MWLNSATMLLWFIHSDNVQFDKFNREADISAIFVLNLCITFTTKKSETLLKKKNDLKIFSVRHLSVLRFIRFFHPRHNGQWPPTSKDFLSQILSITLYFPILILEKEPVFPFLMFSAKQRHYWYHFFNVFGMTRSLTGDWTRDLPHSKPALYH